MSEESRHDLADLAEADDAVLLEAVVVHYERALLSAPDREAKLATLGLDLATSARLRIGFCDRTLGLRIPDRQRKAGATLRRRLTDLGVLRGTGHEALRGCLVVPVLDEDGTAVALFGRPTARGGGEAWATGTGGGVFLVPGASSEPLLVSTSIPEALAVLLAGRGGAVAPGRPGGFGDAELRRLAADHRRIVVVGSEQTAARFSAAGAEVFVGGPFPARPTAEAVARLVEEAVPFVDRPTRPVRNQRAESAAPEITKDDDVLRMRVGARGWKGRPASGWDEPGLRLVLQVTEATNGRFHLDTVDLYLARQRRAFLEAAAAELRVEEDDLRSELAALIAAAEEQRDAAGQTPTVTLSDAERREAESFLSDPDLLDVVGDDLGRLGVVGESDNLLLCYLACVSRLAERPFGVAVQSSSAGGKSTIVDAVCSLVPEEDLLSLSAVTEKALYYLGPRALSHKVLVVAESDGMMKAAYALKLLVSEGRLSIASATKDKRSGRITTIAHETAGPVALLFTTTATEIDPELENRLLVVGASEDTAQTEAVLSAHRQAASEAGLRERLARDDVRRRHRNAQRLLAPFPVVVPDPPAVFCASATRQRRDHQKLLSVVAAAALLHQHQRPRKTLLASGRAVSYVEASARDVEVALGLCSRLLDADADALGPQTGWLLEMVRSHVAERAAQGNGAPGEIRFTRRELRDRLGWSHRQVRQHVERLVSLEALVAAGGGQGQLRTYRVVEVGETEVVRTGGAPVHPGRTSGSRS